MNDLTNPTGNALIGIDPNWQRDQDRRAERDRRLQHYEAQARIAELETALRTLLDAQAHHQGHHERVSAAAMARAVLEKST